MARIGARISLSELSTNANPVPKRDSDTGEEGFNRRLAQKQSLLTPRRRGCLVCVFFGPSRIRVPWGRNDQVPDGIFGKELDLRQRLVVAQPHQDVPTRGDGKTGEKGNGGLVRLD